MENNAIFNYGILPTELDLMMSFQDYTFSIAIMACVCGFVFWLDWNSLT